MLSCGLAKWECTGNLGSRFCLCSMAEHIVEALQTFMDSIVI